MRSFNAQLVWYKRAGLAVGFMVCPRPPFCIVCVSFTKIYWSEGGRFTYFLNSKEGCKHCWWEGHLQDEEHCGMITRLLYEEYACFSNMHYSKRQMEVIGIIQGCDVDVGV